MSCLTTFDVNMQAMHVQCPTSTTVHDGLLHPHLRHCSSPASAVLRLPSAVRTHRRSMFGRRAFSVTGPAAWNSLPDYLRDPSRSFDSFRRYLKTFFLVLPAYPAQRTQRLCDYALHKSTTDSDIDTDKPWRWMLKDISIHKPIWMGFDDLKHIRQLSLCRKGGATLLSTGSHESCVGCRQPEIRRIAL